MEQNMAIYEMAGHLVALHRDKKIDDFDLYNSMLRLAYQTSENERKNLKKIIIWLDSEEARNTKPQEQYSFQNITENAGHDYLEGILRFMQKDISPIN